MKEQNISKWILAIKHENAVQDTDVWHYRLTTSRGSADQGNIHQHFYSLCHITKFVESKPDKFVALDKFVP